MKIYVVTHNPINDNNTEIRQKIKVGGNISNMEYINDSTLCNIADKNPYYCELTALYWMWKNSNEEIIGLEHYRRKFIKSKGLNKIKLLEENDILNILSKHDLIIPYWKKSKESVVSNYKKSSNHCPEDIDALEEIIKTDFPEDYDSFYEYFYNNSKTICCNMFVGKKNIIDKYCSWLFLLFEKLEKKIDFSSREGNKKRIFGYLSERLFGYWIDKNKINYKCCCISLTDNDNLSFFRKMKNYFNYRKNKIYFSIKGYIKHYF